MAKADRMPARNPVIIIKITSLKKMREIRRFEKP
jgi:hypothetical protein